MPYIARHFFTRTLLGVFDIFLFQCTGRGGGEGGGGRVAHLVDALRHKTESFVFVSR